MLEALFEFLVDVIMNNKKSILVLCVIVGIIVLILNFK